MIDKTKPHFEQNFSVKKYVAHTTILFSFVSLDDINIFLKSSYHHDISDNVVTTNLCQIVLPFQ